MTASQIRTGDRLAINGEPCRVVSTRSGSEWHEGWDSFTVMVRESDGQIIRRAFRATDTVTKV
jgi:translation elongation factor P/translation initiation factor 5A